MGDLGEIWGIAEVAAAAAVLAGTLWGLLSLTRHFIRTRTVELMGGEPNPRHAQPAPGPSRGDAEGRVA